MRAWALSSIVLAVAGCTVPSSEDPCEGVTCVASLPAVIDGTTRGSARSQLDTYACDPGTPLGGAETVYRVTLPEAGFLAAARTDGAAPGHTSVRLLRSLDAADCLDAHATRVGALLPAGDAYVVIDSAPGDEGDFSLHVALTTTASLEALGIAHDAAADALTALGHAWAWGATRRHEYAVIDFTLHSAMEREWIVDLSTGELLWSLRVAHGRGSSDTADLAHATTFSNLDGSHQSSLGLYRSSGTYVGTYGPSFRLEGLEPGFNDAVCARDIVMHPWAPVGDEYVGRCGWARPSFGCPAIDATLAMPVRDRLARPDGASPEEGVLYFVWYPDESWHPGSEYLHADAPSPALRAQLSVVCDSSQDGTPTPPASGDYPCD